jgi:hypothetical protein
MEISHFHSKPKYLIDWNKARLSFGHLLALFVLLTGSAWAALINGQPFFMADTSAYVRGPDFAVVYFIGKKFATSWTQDRTLQKNGDNAHVSSASPTAHDTALNSPFDKAVLAGRSIFYGALLYAGHVADHFWLTIFVQAAIFLYLSYTFVVKCLRLSFVTYFWTTVLVLAATPVSFYISFLMPDVFASFLILGVIILAEFWDTLASRDRIFVFAIILYSELAHATHLLLLICLASTFLCLRLIAGKSAIKSGSTLKRIGLLFALILVGIVGALSFTFGTELILHADPIRPPYVTARLIADGPGYQFLQENCATKSYVVCKYVSRMPRPSDTFLWSRDLSEGVFSVVDLKTRTALSSEEPSFVFDVFRSDPIGVLVSMGKNSVAQFLRIGLLEFFPNEREVDSARLKLPAHYYDGLLHSHIGLNASLLPPFRVWYSFFYFISTIALILVWPFLCFVNTRNKTDPQRQWFNIITLTIAAILFNAAICGILSGPHPRYQTRISWIPFFVLCLFVASAWAILFADKGKTANEAT